MNAKQIRISKLLNAETGRAVNIPVDHGIVMGSLPGLTDPVAVVKKLVELGIDSTLINIGLAKITEDLFMGKGAPARILTVDLPLFSTIPGVPETVIEHDLLVGVESALRGDFQAVKVILAWGTEAKTQMKNIRIVAELGDECDRWNMPLMVEPVLWGPAIPPERKNDPELIEHGARIALEAGADILKIPYTGEMTAFADLVRRFRVPVMVLGGAKMKDIRGALEIAWEIVQADAQGVVFGRNVWQHPQMSSVVQALQAIVHRGYDVDTAMSTYGLANG